MILRLIFFLVLASAVTARAGSSGDIATSGRLLTIEQWRSPDGIAWAVKEDQIVAYRMSDYVNSKDTVIAVKAITPGQLAQLKKAIEKLPADVRGYRFDGSVSTHAPLLRLGFRDDSKIDSRGVEICGYWPGWGEEIVGLVSSISGPEAEITFRGAVTRYRESAHPEVPVQVRKIELRRFRGEPEVP